MKSDLLDMKLFVHVETKRAILVSDDGEKENAVWLPLSQIEFVATKDKGIFEVTLPEWLAKEKELI
jgi:hypothetical protein